jgi:16S rRNA (adenine1518-N6/adenine1519-N6)-dimethyltransferase
LIHPGKILQELGISPLKKLGQNFQIDTHVVENVATTIPQGSRILEIGPGLGAWTQIFLARGHEMVLIEKDRTLVARLQSLHADNPKVTVIPGDFLETDTTQQSIATCNAAIGNLPFYITSEILLHIVVEMPLITNALFGIQWEVAERLISGKGSSLSIALGAQGKISQAGKISRNSFYPVPNVDAALISFMRAKSVDRPHLRLLLKAAFWGKRKVLATALRKNPFWEANPVGTAWGQKLTSPPPEIKQMLTQRADELSVANFCSLYDYLNA